MSILTAPISEDELLDRARQIAGMSLQALATQCQVNVPSVQKYAKGWIGQLLELALGATAGSKPEPDFQELGIELKTIPIKADGRPRESTFVCTIPLLDIHKETWENAYVKRKLRRVLWVPVEAGPNQPLAMRKIGSPLLWGPNAEQENALRTDWQELTDMIAMGQLECITAKHGVYLQVRPKAAHGKSLCWGINAEGEKVLTLPRGFYLRARFTEQILREYYVAN